MVRTLCFAAAVLFCLPVRGWADPRCVEAKALNGHVKTVVISNDGRVSSDTGAPRNEPRLWERWSVSQDRRTITIVQYSVDGSPLPQRYPVTMCEFDDSERLVKSVLKLDGLTTFTTVEISYDAEGRKVAVKSRSCNPEYTNDVTYEYSGNAVTARSPQGSAVTTITELDSAGRTTREIRRDEEHMESSEVEYRYLPGTVEILGRENGRNWRITKKLDDMGNTIDTVPDLGPEFRHTARFDYDAQGNWIRCVRTMYEKTGLPLSKSEVVVRQISYFP